MLVALLLAGCGKDAKPAATTAPTEGGPCDLARPDKPIAPPRGLITPQGTGVGPVRPGAPEAPNQKVTGSLPMTPGEFIDAFEHDKRLGILFKENEGRDAEMM